MKNVLIINAYQTHVASKGKLTATLINTMQQALEAKNYTVKHASVQDYKIKYEIQNHLWANFIIWQSPIYWMGVPWMAKKYIDEVYMSGAGVLFKNDGRSATDTEHNYGTGGNLTKHKYMLSFTLNAPKGAFNNTAEFFNGKNIDDLAFPLHQHFKFLGATPLKTIAFYNVIKEAKIDNYTANMYAHINNVF